MTGSSSSSHEESSSQEDSSQWHEGGAVSHVDFGVGLFALALTIGVISISQLTHRLHVPYTVLILCFGLSFGAIFKDFPHALGHSLEDSAHRWVYIDPEIILFTMLPILIFESAFSTCTHTFGKELGQVLTLAGPGVVLGTALTAAFCYYCLPYDWDIYVCLMFGAMLSATDPVAVVALLKELGISERLATLIEGESLLNDGTAVVVFDVFFHAATHHRLLPAGAIAALGARLSLGGPLVGAGVGALGAWAVGFVITKPQAETAVTLVVCLGAFVLAEGTSLQVSGILAVVVAGLTFGQYGTGRISLSALHSVHAFWDALGYLANTTIFFVSGLIMAYKAFQYDQYIDARDWALVVALYLALHAIRALTLALAYPVLAYRGYGLGWRELAVLGWGGLRGAVGLALALIVEENEGLEEAVRARVLFHTAGVALLTLLVNGTTMGALLHALGMDRSNRAEAELFVRAAGVVERKLEAFAASLRRHPHLADADWALVLRYIPVHTSRVYWHRIRHGLVELSREELRDVVGGGPGRRRPREESGGGGGGGAPLLPGWLRRLGGGGEGSWARRAVDRLVPGWHYSALPPRLRSTWWRLHAGFQVPYGHDLAGILEDHALNTHSDAVDAVLHPLSARLRAAAGAVVMKQRGAAGAGAGGAAAPPTPLQSPNPAAAGAARPPPLQSPHHAGGRPGVVTSPAGRRRAPHEGGGPRGVESAVFPSPRIPHVKEMEERMEQAATAAAAAAAEGCAGQEGEGGADGGRGRCATLSSSRVSWAEGGNRSTTPPPGQSAASAAAAAQPPSSDAYHLEIVQTLRQEHHDYLAKIKQLEAKLSEAVRELGSKTQVAQNEVYRAVKINRRKRKQETVIFCKGKPDATPPHSEKRNNTGRRGAADLSPRASFEGKSNPKVAPETMDTLEPAPAMDTSGADSPAGAAAAGAAAAAAAGGTLLVLRPAEAEALAEARARFLAAVRSNYLTLHRQGYIGSGILRVLEQNLQQQMDDASDPLDCWAHLERQFRVPEWLAKITRKTRSVPVLTSALHHLISAHISDCFDVTTTFLTALENVRTTELLPRGAAGDVLASEKAGQLAGARACLETVLPAFPEMVRSLKTRTAARVLLTQHAEICGALAAQGFVSEKEHDLLIESNTKMKKFLASHPVAEKLPSRKSLASRVPFFRYLSSSDATSLAFDESVCHEEFHAAGVYLLGKGERSGPLNPSREGWYFVVRGCVCALDQEYNAEDGLDGKGAAFSSGLPTGARIIHSGSAFGMKSSVLGIPYRHTYISASFTHLIFFDKKELMARARAWPALARGLWLGAAATALALDGAFARVPPRALYKVLHYSFYLDADIRDDGALRAALRPRRRSSLPQVPEEEVAALLSKQQTQQHLPFDEMKEGHITSRDGTTPGQGEEHRSPGTRRKTSPVRKIFVGPAQQNNSTTPRVPNLRFPFSSRKNSIDGFKNTAGLLEDAEEEPKFEHDLEELVHGRSPEGNLLVDIADGDFVLLLQGEIYQQGVPVRGEGEEDEAGGGGGGGGGRHPRHLWGVAGEVALAPGSIAFVVPHEVLDWAHADARAHQAQQHAEGVDALHAHEVHRARAGMTQAWAQDYYRPDDHHVREAADRLKERDREERRAARAGPPPQLPTSPKKGGLARRNSAMLASATSIKSYKLHRGQGNEGDEGSSPVFIPHDGRREALCSSNVNTFKQEEGQGLQEGLTSV